MRKCTRVKVTVTFEADYEVGTLEDEIDVNDIIRDSNAIRDIKVSSRSVTLQRPKGWQPDWLKRKNKDNN